MRFLVLMIVMLSSFTVSSAEYGLGLSIRDNDARIYLPVKISKNILAEPYVGVGERKEQTDNENDETKRKYDDYTAGLRVFYFMEPSEKVSTYFGIGVGIIRGESEYERIGGCCPIETSYESRSTIIAPTFGIGYSFTDSLLLSLEASYDYEKVKVKHESKDDNGTSTSSFEIYEKGTQTNILLRYFFN